MEMMIDGQPVKVYSFADEPEMPWFQAKPILSSLGYSNVTMTLARLEQDERKGLKELIEAKGTPLGGGQFNLTPLGHNDGKAIFVNEWGLYSLILGSKKPEARVFKRWVTRDVLPSIRKKGFYGDVQTANTTVAMLTSAVGNLTVALNERDSKLKDFMREHSSEQLEAARASFSEVVASKFSGFMLSLVGHLSSTVTAAVATGLGLKKAQPKKRTTSAADMPEDQRATPLQTGPLSLGLSTVALELFPEMPFAAWKKVRGSFGHHAKKERLRLHALGERHPEYVAAPLLWAYTGSSSTVEGGGARYVYLAEHGALLKRVFRTQLQTSRVQRGAGAPAPTESLEQRVHRLAAGLSLAEKAMQWPVHVAEFEPHWNEGDEGL
jgi:prophage antirepressor-like protein